MDQNKLVYAFGNGHAEGNGKMKELLGGKGANLAEMNLIGVPVPPGFTITTETCAIYGNEGKEATIKKLSDEVVNGIREIESIMDAKFNGDEFPLLISVRSGARVSMPGMMDTVLNLGLNDKTVETLAEVSNNPRFAWDSYRRLLQMYGGVVLGMKPETKEDIDPFEHIIEEIKEEKGVELDTDLDVEDLKTMVDRFKEAVKTRTGHDFPQDPWEQLWSSIMAVFDSWNGNRAKVYRRINQIPEEWGTAVNVQAMVYGNMGNDSATGVAFTRDAATGEDVFNGEYLINAQGEDVVAGVRTPQQINIEGSRKWAALANISEEDRAEKYPSLEEIMPDVYRQLDETQQKLEDHYRDMQDLEFTVQKGKLWILQTRDGKRTGFAMVRIAMEMRKNGLISDKDAILRMEPDKLNELLHPVFDEEAKEKAEVIARGLPASPGAATGQVVFHADDAVRWAERGKAVILVRMETSPEDVAGMNSSKGILTARGGMTSHAAVVARGMGKCCIAGAGECAVNYKEKQFVINGSTVVNEGDWISLNGTTGEVYKGKITTQEPELSGHFDQLMKLSDSYAKLNVRANADTGKDARTARLLGARGIGLARTEHMFFEDEKIRAVREMILAEDSEGRERALMKILPLQQQDFEDLFREMDGLPVTIRLLDPPLHEFLPQTEESQAQMAKNLGITVERVQTLVEELAESNPMLGHRGCRLGNSYPSITRIQSRAILGAALKLKKEGIVVKPEIMVPLAGIREELRLQVDVIHETAEQLFAEEGDRIEFKVGTMIEVPRAALVADRFAELAEFFSFGTNDLTQMTMGYSRDDVGHFLPTYIKRGILPNDPFESIDEIGVGQLVKLGFEKGRSVNPDLPVGVCGEHGGDPASIAFCHRVGLNYVSCSPFRVPIARLAAAQATLLDTKKEVIRY